MGLRCLTDLNQALVAKLSWRFLNDDNSLWCKILKAKYLNNVSFWDAKKPNKCSTAWSAMLARRNHLKKGCLWLVGNSLHINIRSDPWIPTAPDLTASFEMQNMSEITKLNQLLDTETGKWNLQLLQQIFDPFTATQINNIQIHKEAENKFIWHLTKHGDFTPQSFQKLLLDQAGESSVHNESSFP